MRFAAVADFTIEELQLIELAEAAVVAGHEPIYDGTVHVDCEICNSRRQLTKRIGLIRMGGPVLNEVIRHTRIAADIRIR